MLPSYKRPRFYTLLKELLHTATSKLLHYKLRERAARDRACGRYRKISGRSFLVSSFCAVDR